MSERIGTVFGEASTEKFTFIFPRDLKQSLKNAFVYVDMKKYKIIGKVTNIITENPLLSPETMKFFVEKSEIGSEISGYLKSERFMFFTAECEVLGELNEKEDDIIPVTKPVETGADVYFLEPEKLEKLFFEDKSYNLYPGYIETPNKTKSLAKFSLKGDEIITMHCAIFGMTGMGKTTTTATLLEELTIRGAKSIIFDPHGDYINLGILRSDIYNSLSNKISDKLKNFIEQYKNYLNEKWQKWIEEKHLSNEDKIYRILEEEKEEELHERSILFRLILLMSILRKEVPNVDNSEDLLKNIEEFYGRYDFSFEKFKNESGIPETLLARLIKLVLSVFPSIKFDNTNYDIYYILNLISAYSGEEITEAQEGLFINLFKDQNDQKVNELTGENQDFLNKLLKLLEKAKSLEKDNASKSLPPMIRKIKKALKTIEILEKNEVIPINSKDLIKEFASENGKYNIVSNIVFDLTNVSPEIVQRVLLYDVIYNAFNMYKSKDLSLSKGDSHLTFFIEEARVLIPKSGIEDIEHPATKSARNIVRRLATEGRKMGLGLVIISQKPSSVDNIPVSQCNTLILHRVINPEDLSFVKSVGEAISDEDIENLKLVERGVSIITGTALKIRKSLMVRFRNRISEEGRRHPTPLKDLWENK